MFAVSSLGHTPSRTYVAQTHLLQRLVSPAAACQIFLKPLWLRTPPPPTPASCSAIRAIQPGNPTKVWNESHKAFRLSRSKCSTTINSLIAILCMRGLALENSVWTRPPWRRRETQQGTNKLAALQRQFLYWDPSGVSAHLPFYWHNDRFCKALLLHTLTKLGNHPHPQYLQIKYAPKLRHRMRAIWHDNP